MLKLLQFDLMTLDLNLPGLGGDELLEHVRATAHTRQLPVILLSAQEPNEETQALANVVMRKPFEALALIAVVQQLLTIPPLLNAHVVGS